MRIVTALSSGANGRRVLTINYIKSKPVHEQSFQKKKVKPPGPQVINTPMLKDNTLPIQKSRVSISNLIDPDETPLPNLDNSFSPHPATTKN
jgi:hypothetical protein